jgi:modulator of drug activity B
MAQAKKVLLINSHLTYPNWTEGTLNNAFYQAAMNKITEKNKQKQKDRRKQEE